MSSRLINVRLDPERLRKAQTLREHGVNLSDVVREAIDERFVQLRSVREPDVKALIRRIFEQYPDPAGLPPATMMSMIGALHGRRYFAKSALPGDDPYRYHSAGGIM